MGLNPKGLLTDFKFLSLLFEDFAVHELRVYADSIDAKVKHYRDKDGLECDAIIELKNGKVGFCEIKLGGDDLIKEGVMSLAALSKKLDRPDLVVFRMIVTAFGPCVRRKNDGIWIVPVNCLC